MGNTVDESKLEFTEEKATWLVGIEQSLFDEEIREIIKFFVMENPHPHISARRISLKDYGWDSERVPIGGYLQTKMMDVAGLVDNVSIFQGYGREEMKDVFFNAGMHENFFNGRENRIALLVYDKNLIMSVFKHIRNAMAHCRFNITDADGEVFFVMENGLGNDNKFEVKSRMVLKKATLSQWINIIKNDSTIAKAAEDRENAKIDAKVLNVIKSIEVKKKDIIAETLDISLTVIEESLKRLKENDCIEYKSKQWVMKNKENAA